MSNGTADATVNGGGLGTPDMVVDGGGLSETEHDALDHTGLTGVGISQADADDRYVNESGDTMTGQLLLPDGTAAVPAVAFANDPDTGFMKWTPDGRFAVVHNGSPLAFLQSSEWIIRPRVHISPGTAAFPSLAKEGDSNTGLFFPAADQLGLVAGGVQAVQARDPGSDTEVGMLVRVNRAGAFSLDQVTIGAADSGGTGFRVLRVPN